MKPLGLSQNALARAIGVPPRRINEIVLGKRTVMADAELRLELYFGLCSACTPIMISWIAAARSAMIWHAVCHA